ncbi:solute carrier family 25 member 48-like isoform X2 [Cetorhinus maximus]
MERIVQLDDFIAGWIGGAASVIVGHPLDTVKTRLQAGHGYKNTVQCVLTIFKNEHVAGFFKGLSFPLASVAVYNSVALGVYGNAQRYICQYRHGDNGHQSPALSDVAAASAVVGLVTVGIGAPVDLVKIRLQMQTQSVRPAKLNLVGASAIHSLALNDQPLYRGPVHCISRILRNEGIVGLYRGVGAMYLRDVPGYCLYFVPYMLLCDWMTPVGSTAPNLFCVWLAGGVAGIHRCSSGNTQVLARLTCAAGTF